jgi:hypothetical protein
MDKVSEIKQLYLTATKATIARHIEQAIAILKSMDSDEERERAAVFMDGLVEMRSDWGLAPKSASALKPPTENGKRKTEKTGTSRAKLR